MAIIEITNDNFEAEVKNSTTPVLVDFWADWCGPCKMLSPIVDELSEEIEDVKFAKLNTDVAPELAGQFGVMSIPTLIIFKNGEPVAQSIGVVPKEDLIEFINDNK